MTGEAEGSADGRNYIDLGEEWGSTELDEASVLDAFERATAAELAGDAAAALHILKSAHPGKVSPKVAMTSDGNIEFVYPVSILTLLARTNLLSLQLGQWGDSPRHDPNADTPHGWVTQYESLNPRLPEAGTGLRLWMDRLRVSIASDHQHYEHMAAWALDLYRLQSEADLSPELETEALVNMAVAMSHLGFKNTARRLYGQVEANPAIDGANRAALEVRFGDFLWSVDDRVGADHYYTSAIDRYNEVEIHSLNDLHNLVRARARRADSLYRRKQGRAALDDVIDGIETADVARGRGVYQAARSVDAGVRIDLLNLTATLGRLPLGDADAESVVGIMLRLANTSLASWIRLNRVREDLPEAVYVLSSHERTVQEAQARAAAHWHPISGADIQSVLDPDQPTLMSMTTRIGSSGIEGVTVQLGGGRPPTCHTWSLDRENDSDAMSTLRSLLTPPPGSTPDDDSVWGRPWSPNDLAKIADRLFVPFDLKQRIDSDPDGGLRIIPVGAMWRFPFAAIPVDGVPLGAAVPIVMAPGPALNLERPEVGDWAGHFDLKLTYAIPELQSLLAVAKTRGVSVLLFDHVEQLSEASETSSITTLVFSGHGQVRRAVQSLLMADGSKAHASDFKGFVPGSSIVLNACWSGSVLDTVGSDLVQQSLEFVARGAHSVLGTIGPVSDRYASKFLRACLPRIAAGESLARAHQGAIMEMSHDPNIPLSAWASHTTIGRHTEFVPQEGGTS